MTQIGPEPNEVDEIAMLEARRLSILEAFDQEPMTKQQAYAAIDELAEIETALQKYGAAMSDIGDAKLCNKFGCSL
jgi:hypothetical protein